jgi:glucokinase
MWICDLLFAVQKLTMAHLITIPQVNYVNDFSGSCLVHTKLTEQRVLTIQ